MVSGGSDKTRRFGGGGGMAAGLAAGVATLRGRLRRATRREHPAWPLHSRADARIAETFPGGCEDSRDENDTAEEERVDSDPDRLRTRVGATTGRLAAVRDRARLRGPGHRRGDGGGSELLAAGLADRPGRRDGPDGQRRAGRRRPGAGRRPRRPPA